MGGRTFKVYPDGRITMIRKNGSEHAASKTNIAKLQKKVPAAAMGFSAPKKRITKAKGTGKSTPIGTGKNVPISAGRRKAAPKGRAPAKAKSTSGGSGKIRVKGVAYKMKDLPLGAYGIHVDTGAPYILGESLTGRRQWRKMRKDMAMINPPKEVENAVANLPPALPAKRGRKAASKPLPAIPTKGGNDQYKAYQRFLLAYNGKDINLRNRDAATKDMVVDDINQYDPLVNDYPGVDDGKESMGYGDVKRQRGQRRDKNYAKKQGAVGRKDKAFEQAQAAWEKKNDAAYARYEKAYDEYEKEANSFGRWGMLSGRLAAPTPPEWNPGASPAELRQYKKDLATKSKKKNQKKTDAPDGGITSFWDLLGGAG